MIGTAVPRAPLAANSLTYLPSRVLPYYSPVRTFGSFGRGYSYSPFWFQTYAYPMFGYGMSAGYASDAWDASGPSGRLRLQVEPSNAQVYVDGYYAGVVDDFDGRVQHLDLTPGPHHLEIVAPGYQPLIVDIAIEARHKITYRGTLVPVLASGVSPSVR